MSDFHQHGPITTLHRLSDAHLAEVEREMLAASAQRPATLILPCHAEDFGRRPLARILGELSAVGWLADIVIAVNGFSSLEEIQEARRPLSQIAARPIRWLWADGPIGRELRGEWTRAGVVSREIEPSGKGWNVWLGLGLALAENQRGVVAVHDTDIVNYRREMLIRLCAPVLHPALGYEFAKGYYRRVTEGVMFGRVTRLMMAPLLRAAIRVFGHQPLLDHLSSFRYPLAGECAFDLGVAGEMPICAGWGLELGWLCEIHRRVAPNRICQVELGANYEHKHRPLHGARGRAGLVDLARAIVRTFVGELRAEGVLPDSAARHALESAYRKSAAEAVERHAHDAALNTLQHDAAAERAAVDAFAGVLAETVAEPAAAPAMLPAWRQVLARRPSDAGRLRELAVL